MTFDEAIRMFSAINQVGDRIVDTRLGYALAANKRKLLACLDEYNDVLRGAPKDAVEFSKAVQEAVNARQIPTPPDVPAPPPGAVSVQDGEGLKRDLQSAMREWPDGKKQLEDHQKKVAEKLASEVTPPIEFVCVPIELSNGFPFGLVDALFPMFIESASPA